MTGGLFTPSGSLPPLWSHQERAFAELRARMLAGAAHVMLMIPTGGGKTRLAVEIIKNAVVKRKRVVVLVPRISLVPQWLRALADAGITCVGVLQADHPGYDPDQPLQLCSVQTLGRRMRPPADLVIVDEAHLLYKAVLAWLTDPEQKHVRFVGLSATPWTTDLGASMMP